MEIKGKDLVLYVVVSGINVPIFHSRTCTINTTATTLPSTTLGSGFAETNEYSGKYAYTIKGDGLVYIGDNATGLTLQIFQTSFTKVNWTFTDNANVQWYGVALVTSTTFDSPFDNVSSFNMEFQGDGEYTFIDSNVPPVPVINASVRILDQFGNLITSVPAPGSYTVTKFNAIDCGNAFQNTPAIIITA